MMTRIMLMAYVWLRRHDSPTGDATSGARPFRG